MLCHGPGPSLRPQSELFDVPYHFDSLLIRLRAEGSNALLIHLLILALYTLFPCLLGFPTNFLFSFFPYLCTSLLAFSFGIDPLCFQTRSVNLLIIVHRETAFIWVGDGGGGHWLVRMEWRPAGWSVCLPLLIFLCNIKSRSSLLAPAHPGGPGERAVKRLWWCGVRDCFEKGRQTAVL